jgi:hypothetical protein
MINSNNNVIAGILFNIQELLSLVKPHPKWQGLGAASPKPQPVWKD